MTWRAITIRPCGLAEIVRHHASLPRGSPAATVAAVCAPRVAAAAPLRALAAAVCARAAELAAESVPFGSLRTASFAPGPAMRVAEACAKSEGKRAHARPAAIAAGWRLRSIGDAIAAQLGVDPKTVAPALSRFYATDVEVAHRAINAVNAALADPCDAAAATAAIVCPVASAATGAANVVERCAVAASTLATPTCGARHADVHAAQVYAACAAAAVASLPCSKTCTAALAALPVHCGAIVPRADHGFTPGAQHGAACEVALHAAQAGCDTAGNGSDTDGACSDLLEAAPPSLLRHVAAKHADGHIQYLHFADQSARGVMPSSMCRHGTVHHVDLRGNNLMGSVPECAWSGGQALGNGNLYLSRNLLSGTIGKLGAGHRNIHVNHNRLGGDMGAALADAHSLRTLQASRNRFTGTLDALKGKSSVRHVHVEGNRLTDTADSPVAAVLASLPDLQSYEISNNRFASHAAAAAAAWAVGKSGSAAKRVDHVALGAAKVAVISRSVHVVTHLRGPIAHICPMCGDAGQEANCGAVPQCRKHPDILSNVPEDMRRSMSALMPKIAPEVVNHGEAVDVVETMQCALKHEAERFMARGNVAGVITAVRVERTVPLGGSSTILSFTLDASTPEAAAAAMRGLRLLRHVATDGSEFPVPAHCFGGGGEDSRAGIHVGVLHDVEVRMGCPPGLLGSRCQYACRTRWERFDHRVLPESYDTSHQSARKDHADDEIDRHGSSHVSNHRNTVSELGATVRPVPVRKLLELQSANAVAAAAADPDAFPDWSADADRADHADNVEHDSDDEPEHFPAHMKHSNRFRDEVLATTHFFHGGHHTKQHKMGMILSGCSVGCRGHANLAHHHCNAFIDSGRSDDAQLDKCTEYLADAEFYCKVSVAGGDCPAEKVTPWREQTTAEHTEACEVCGLLRHWGQHGLHHEADAAPEEPGSAPGSGPNKKARLGKKVAKGTWYTCLAEMHSTDRAASRGLHAEESRRVSARHGYAPHEHSVAHANLHRAIAAAAAGEHHNGAAIPHLDEHHNTALRDLTSDLLRSHVGAHKCDIAAALGQPADAAPADLHSDLHAKLLQHAAKTAASNVHHAEEHGSDHEARMLYPGGSRSVMAGQFPSCHAPTSCGAQCSKAVDDALARCTSWADADEPPGAPRDACEAHLDAAEATCAEEPGEGAGGAAESEGTAGTGVGGTQRHECYAPAAAGFRALLGSSDEWQRQQRQQQVGA